MSQPEPPRFAPQRNRGLNRYVWVVVIVQAVFAIWLIHTVIANRQADSLPASEGGAFLTMIIFFWWTLIDVVLLAVYALYRLVVWADARQHKTNH